MTFLPHYSSESVMFPVTVDWRNYFTSYGVLLCKLPPVLLLFSQSNDNEIVTLKCREIWKSFHELILLINNVIPRQKVSFAEI